MMRTRTSGAVSSVGRSCATATAELNTTSRLRYASRISFIHVPLVEIFARTKSEIRKPLGHNYVNTLGVDRNKDMPVLRIHGDRMDTGTRERNVANKFFRGGIYDAACPALSTAQLRLAL